MEPHIIEYYNDMPNSVNVINKMNEEFDENDTPKTEKCNCIID